jgi:hypothetical protein
VRSARTEDLRAELNRRCAGEDARVSIEWARGRRLSIEGRDLDAEFAVVAPALQGPVQAPVSGVGCAALADHLHAIAWPSKFRPHLPEKYGGTTNPSEFLQVYITAITVAGGNDAVMASYFHVALTGPDLAHEPYSGIHPILGGAVRTVHGKFCQCVPAARCGGPPPRCEAATRRNPPDLHLPLHQGAWNYSAHLRCVYYHGISPGGSVMRRCWRSWRLTRWKLSPPCSL